MKRFLLGLILGIGLSAVVGVKAQDAVPTIRTCGWDQFDHPLPCPTIHEHDLTVKEIVEILAEVDVHHAKQQPFFQPAYGATTFQTTPVQVWIFDDATVAEKRSTIFHEMLHVWCHNEGIDCSEDWVASEEMRQYRAVFGGTK